ESFEQALPSLLKPGKGSSTPAAPDGNGHLHHGSVVIAAITSCTNTSNPSVMIAAGLVAKRAVERGLQVPSYVKTSLAPGSKVVRDYLERAGLTPYLEKLKFHIVGYGCTTCIGNSGPLPPEISQAIDENDLVVASVLSGNRNFEGRINPDVRAAPYFGEMKPKPASIDDIKGARALAVLGDSVTTDHISPAGSIKKDSPAGKYLIEHGVKPVYFNSYGSRRGNHEVMVRGTFANVRLRNKMVPNLEGGFTRHLPDGAEMTIFDASEKYLAESVPLVIIAGKEYGSGSSRDWSAQGPL